MHLIERLIYFGIKVSEEEPPVDIYETERAYFIVFDIPGIEPDNLLLKICDRTLILAGTRPRVNYENVIWHCREIPTADFQRTLQLPDDIEPSDAEATYHDGMLEVILPKKKQKVFKIKIKGA